MKTIFFRTAALLSLGLTLGLTACDKQLDIKPEQSVDATTALNSEEKVGSAVVGIYAQLDNSNLYGTNLILVPELLGPDNYILFQGTFTNLRDLSRRQTKSDNTSADAIWREAYQAINQANLVIDALPVVANASVKDQYQGEALFIRGDMYFELVRLYGKQYNAATASTDLGVPINLLPVRTVEEANRRLPRATVAQVYAQVIDDLTKAIALLPEDNADRADSYSAKALLARVYLQQSNFAAAGALANDVIENSGRTLAPTLQAVFTSRNSTESLFEIQQNDQNNAGTANAGLATHFASIGQLGRGDVLVLPTFVSLYAPSDARGSDPLIYNSTGARSVAPPAVALRSGKYTSYGQNIPVIRLGEMFLIRAEANQRLGTTVGATPNEDVNRIRARSQAPAINPLLISVGGTQVPNPSPLAGTVTIADILLERQLELAFEGFRIHDLKRTGTDLVTSSGAIIPITSNLLVLPIPKRETDLNDAANPVLIQNPGY